MTALPAHPILSCDEARAFEARLFGGDETHEWPAMQRAGRAMGAAVLNDFREIGGFSAAGRVLVLVGKGHNGGDALIAARAILEQYPQAGADVLFVFGEHALRPLAQRAWQELLQAAPQRVTARRLDPVAASASEWTKSYDLCLDGVFGFQFRSPLDERAGAALRWANAQPVRLRAAVDLPSGLDTAGAFRADFTYATGVVKTPALACPNAGRLRYLDLGFFGMERVVPNALDYVLTSEILSPLSALRSPLSPPHLFVAQDRLAISPDNQTRFLEAAETALHFGQGEVFIFHETAAGGFTENGHYSRGLHSPKTGRTFRPATPALFSFNSPLGACPKCRGFGRVIEIDYRLAIPDQSLSIDDGALKCWEGEVYSGSKDDLKVFARRKKIPTNIPFAALTLNYRS